MSLVGPRPERPEFVTGLERRIPFARAERKVNVGVAVRRRGAADSPLSRFVWAQSTGRRCRETLRGPSTISAVLVRFLLDQNVYESAALLRPPIRNG
jgi:hypothetical protein